ncbi:MAG: cation:dicarboxylase symporter family transporter [Bacteroidetes bacterium]|nr:cation:dicarboxylase symporter family transporter [Bacteroidota bacterium]
MAKIKESIPRAPKSLSYRIFTNTALHVLTAIIAGVLVGHFYPATGVKMEIIGKGFVNVIKVFIAPIIFLTIVLGISSMGDLKKVGRIGIKSLVYFEIVTTFALTLGLLVAHFLRPGDIDLTGLTAKDASQYTQNPQAFSWLGFFLSNLTLQVLVIALVAGIIISNLSQRQKIVSSLETASEFVFRILKVVMYLAPIGAFGGMAFAVGKFGIASLLPLGKLLVCVYITMALFIFLILGAILRYYKVSVLTFLKYIKEELLIVLGTSSSEAALPSLMNKLEKMGCSKSVVGLVVPTGYSFNLDGTSIYLSMAVIFIAQLYKVDLSVAEMASIIGILMLTSKGAAGVTGSGFIVLASTLTAIHKIPVEGLAFLLGVDKFMSEARAITNIIGNGVATIVIAKSEKEFIHPVDESEN